MPDWLTWSREVATTSLVARSACPRLGKCLLSNPPALAAFSSHGPFPYLEAAMTPRQQKNLRHMTPGKRKNVRQPSSAALRVTRPHAAGLDVHAPIHWVAVSSAAAPPPAANHPANLPAHVRSFGACTADLIALADWLAQCGVTTIAMESTGIYWIP